MKLSESLRKNIIETGIGRIVNKFHLPKRRNVMIFEEILTNYIKTSINSGHGEEMKNIAKHWAFLYIKNFLPKIITRIPNEIFLNTIMRNVWTNIGLLDNFKITRKGKIITITTLNEGISREIGKNEFSQGLWSGVLSALYNSDAENIETYQYKNTCKYTFRLKDTPLNISSKGIDRYCDFNTLHKQFSNSSFENALKSKTFVLKGNRIFFRGKPVVMGENTLFHIIGHKGPLIEKVAEISYECFRKIIDKTSSMERKIFFLKNMLQIFGWGQTTIFYRSNGDIIVSMKNQPYGIQKEEDNWKFLSNVVLGYLFLCDKNYTISKTVHRPKVLKITFNAQ